MKRFYVRREGGKLGSLDGPAIRTSSGLRVWMVDGKHHRSDGPAVVTAAGTEGYYWRGVRVPKEAILSPRSKSVTDILGLPNAEVRRAWLEAYGLAEAIESMLEKGKAVLVHTEPEPEPRRLIKIVAIKDVENAHPVYVEVMCPSTKRVYHLRVPPTMQTCREAVAWTFNKTESEYVPGTQT